MNSASVPQAFIFIFWPLGGVLTSEHWSFSYERCLGSAYVGVPTGRLQAVVYKYRLLLLTCGSSLFCNVGGSHKSYTSNEM
jgi:hypothetical protein